MNAVTIDLFAGPGGWDVGARMLGMTDVVGVELDAATCRTARHYGHQRHHGDVSRLIPREIVAGWSSEVGGLIASPPCQGFSIAGEGKSRDDSQLLLDGLAWLPPTADAVAAFMVELRAFMTDTRTALVLEPLRWALDLRPAWIAWEQVPTVQPIWDECADLLRAVGYTVSTSVLDAVTFGVPQVRRRSILVARDAASTMVSGPATMPQPTHSAYHASDPERLDVGVLPWVSMADALGWDNDEIVGFPRLNDRDDDDVYRARDLRPAGHPSFAVTGKSRSWERWQIAAGTAGGGVPRTAEHPSPTITGAGSAMWIDNPATYVGATRARFNDQSGTAFDPLWPTKRPATTVAGRDIVQNPGTTANRFNGSTKSRNDGVRVSVQEAGILQSFPADYPWQGTRTKRFQQVGDAMPPLFARAVLDAVRVPS